MWKGKCIPIANARKVYIKILPKVKIMSLNKEISIRRGLYHIGVMELDLPKKKEIKKMLTPEFELGKSCI